MRADIILGESGVVRSCLEAGLGPLGGESGVAEASQDFAALAFVFVALHGGEEEKGKERMKGVSRVGQYLVRTSVYMRRVEEVSYLRQG